MKPLVSVVIPTHNEEKDIEECLNSLGKQSFRNFEIIIVDDGSEDNTKELVKKFKVNLVESEHKGPGLSRNLGVKKSKGKIIVLIDSDMTFHKDYIKNLVEPILQEKSIIGTTHEQEIVRNIDNIWSKCWGKFRVTKENARDVKIFRAIKKDKFLEMGGFDPKYGYADDQTFWFKYKIKPEVAKNTICYHRNPETFLEVYRQSRWIGSSHLLLDVPMGNIFFVSFLYLISPVAIPVLSLRQVYRVKMVGLLFPYIFIFMTARYFGTLHGCLRKIIWNINIR